MITITLTRFFLKKKEQSVKGRSLFMIYLQSNGVHTKLLFNYWFVIDCDDFSQGCSST